MTRLQRISQLISLFDIGWDEASTMANYFGDESQTTPTNKWSEDRSKEHRQRFPYGEVRAFNKDGNLMEVRADGTIQ